MPKKILVLLLLVGLVGIVTFLVIGSGSTVKAQHSRDLVPTIFNVPAVGSHGQVIPVDIEVTNVGTVPSPTYHVAFILSPDATIDASDSLIVSVRRGTLGPNMSDQWTQPIRMPDNIVQGRYYIGVAVDSKQRVSENDETNNTVVDQLDLLKGLPLSECVSLASDGTPYMEGVNCRIT